jgi:feruloyl esterase
VAAQRYPADWDGIIAGSPALRWTEQLAKFGAIQHRLRSSSANWISTSQLPAIQSAAIATCGERLDCRVDTRKLICRGDAACLTPAQAASLDAIQGDPLGFDPRFAAIPQNWDQWIVNPDRSAPSELAFATTAYRYLVHENALWEIERFDTRRDPLLASDKKIGSKRLAEILNADDPDLRGFARHGGKLIIYVGTADALISPRAGTEYFNAVWKRMGAIANDVGRLFVIPGMQHCQGGLAPNSFGQAWVAPALRPDPRFDVRLALEAWVERGRAPQALVAVRYSDGQSNEVVRKTIRAYRAGTADGDAR